MLILFGSILQSSLTEGLEASLGACNSFIEILVFISSQTSM
jgi:hypothetical protein